MSPNNTHTSPADDRTPTQASIAVTRGSSQVSLVSVNATPPNPNKFSPSQPKKAFVSLAKPFDLNPNEVSYRLDDFKIDESNRQTKASCGPRQQLHQADHVPLDRNWGSDTRRQNLEKLGVDSLKSRATEKPLSRWEAEEAVDGPYHGMSSVKEGSADCSGRKKNGKEKRVGGKAGTW